MIYQKRLPRVFGPIALLLSLATICLADSVDELQLAVKSAAKLVSTRQRNHAEIEHILPYTRRRLAAASALRAADPQSACELASTTLVRLNALLAAPGSREDVAQGSRRIPSIAVAQAEER